MFTWGPGEDVRTTLCVQGRPQHTSHVAVAHFFPLRLSISPSSEVINCTLPSRPESNSPSQAEPQCGSPTSGSSPLNSHSSHWRSFLRDGPCCVTSASLLLVFWILIERPACYLFKLLFYLPLYLAPQSVSVGAGLNEWCFYLFCYEFSMCALKCIIFRLQQAYKTEISKKYIFYLFSHVLFSKCLCMCCVLSSVYHPGSERYVIWT